MGQAELQLGTQIGSALARGVIEWKQIQKDRQQKKEFEGRLAIFNQRTISAQQAVDPSTGQILNEYDAQMQRNPNADWESIETGEIGDDGNPKTEPIVRTREGDIPVAQYRLLKTRKRQDESSLMLAEMDALSELQLSLGDNPYAKQFVAGKFAAIKQKWDIRNKQAEFLLKENELENARERNQLGRDELAEKRRQFDAAPGREQAGKTFETDEGIRRDAARIEAEKQAKLTTDAAQVQAAKPATEMQGRAANFGRRAEQAVGELESIENYDRAAISSGLSSKLPNFMQPEERQRINQAERNFVNAMLRRDSGAVIKDEEFQNYEQQFFPRAGDKPGNVAQKKRNRELAVQALKGEAGPAWGMVPAGETSQTAGGGDMVRVRAPDGRVGVIPRARLQEALSAGGQQVQ